MEQAKDRTRAMMISPAPLHLPPDDFETTLNLAAPSGCCTQCKPVKAHHAARIVPSAMPHHQKLPAGLQAGFHPGLQAL